MSAEQLVSRIISSEAMVESKAMRTGKLSTEQWDNIAHAADKLAGCDILIDDTSNITVSGMIGKLRRVENLGLVVVDYLQLMQGENTKSDNRAQVVGDISRGLKLMAKELNVPIICCAQLSRDNEKRGTSSNSKRPVLSDLRDSGSIEQDADIVIFIHREEYYNQEAKGEGGSAYDIGRDALRVLLAAEEGTVPFGELCRLTLERLGAESAHSVLSELYKKDKTAVSSLAPAVFEADELGDEAAKGIILRNIEVIKKKLSDAKRAFGAQGEIVCGGGLFNSKTFCEMLADRVEPLGFTLYIPTLPQSLGASIRAAMAVDKIDKKQFAENFKNTV